MSVTPIFWSAMLLLVGLSLLMAEIFVPSGGLIGFLSFCSITAAIVMAFYQSGPVMGVSFLIVSFVAVPCALAAAFRFLPYTPMGKRLLPDLPTSEDVMPDNDERRKLRELLGRVGRAKSRMLPSGSVVVDNHIFDAVSEGQPIEPGHAVRVIAVRGTLVVVRPIEEHEARRTAAGR